MPIIAGVARPTQVLGYQELDVPAFVVAFTNIPQGTEAVYLHFENGPIRGCLDGSTPVAGGFGMGMYDGDSMTVGAHEASVARFIREGGVNGIVKALFLRWM